MQLDPSLALGQFATLTAIAALIVALVEVIKRAAGWADAQTQRFAPLTALVLGIALMALLGIATTGITNFAQTVFAGIVTGLYSQGLYNTGGSAVIGAVAPKRL